MVAIFCMNLVIQYYRFAVPATSNFPFLIHKERECKNKPIESRMTRSDHYLFFCDLLSHIKHCMTNFPALLGHVRPATKTMSLNTGRDWSSRNLRSTKETCLRLLPVLVACSAIFAQNSNPIQFSKHQSTEKRQSRHASSEKL